MLHWDGVVRFKNLRWSQKSERKYSQNCSIVHVLNIWLLSEETCPFCFDICKLFIALKVCTKDSIFVSKSAWEKRNTTKRALKDKQYNLCLYKVHLKETLILRLLETIIVLVYLAKSVTKKYNFFTWKIHFEQCPFFLLSHDRWRVHVRWKNYNGRPKQEKDGPKCLSTGSHPFSKQRACS